MSDELARLAADGGAVDQRIVVRRIAVDVHDEEAILAARDGGHLDARAAERGQGLVQLELAAREGTGEHLQLGLLDRHLAVETLAHAAGGNVGGNLLGPVLGRLHLLGGGARRRLDDHRLFEFVLGLVVFDETQLVMTHGDDVAVLQRMLLDELAVDVRAVGAVQILEERVVEDVDDQRVMTRHRRVVDADVVIGEAANRVPLLVHVVFGEDLVIQA